MLGFAFALLSFPFSSQKISSKKLDHSTYYPFYNSVSTTIQHLYIWSDWGSMIYANSYDWTGPAWLRSNDVEGSCTHHPLSNPIQTTKQCNEIDEAHSRNKPFPSQYQPSHQSSSRWWVDRRSPLWSFRENWKTQPHSNKVWNALWTQAKTRLLGAFVQVPCARSLSKSLGTTCCKKAYICFNIYIYTHNYTILYIRWWLKSYLHSFGYIGDLTQSFQANQLQMNRKSYPAKHLCNKLLWS